MNWPEVAILGVARARMEPVFTDGEFVARFMMPLTLSYDHRVIDGADGARILRWIVEAIEQPALMWLDVAEQVVDDSCSKCLCKTNRQLRATNSLPATNYHL